ncbi:hypothetical protein [Ktedonospora formicarum]|uniref:Uncharacterized protein n=1 Tax=Ktedonospora formicarum TaxID=2778364 RepID=A0A8J3MRG4_9CHLR|nr:hypothetical protein [Ktedonospora formicarum]GHO42230.1 hypothetical protein KSX_03930 [Ktedonospora formicarum]
MPDARRQSSGPAHAYRHLDKAFLNFFEGSVKYPTFQRKRNRQSATYTANAFIWRNGNITLACDA